MKTEFEEEVWTANYGDLAYALIREKLDLLLAVGTAQIAEEVADELGIPVEMAESMLPDMVCNAVKGWI